MIREPFASSHPAGDRLHTALADCDQEDLDSGTARAGDAAVGIFPSLPLFRDDSISEEYVATTNVRPAPLLAAGSTWDQSYRSSSRVGPIRYQT